MGSLASRKSNRSSADDENRPIFTVVGPGGWDVPNDEAVSADGFAPKPIDFGELDIDTTRKATLTIRNNSAIPSSFDLSVDKYHAAEVEEDSIRMDTFNNALSSNQTLYSSSSNSLISKKRELTRPILGIDITTTVPFKSKAGATHKAKQSDKKRRAGLLANNLGMALSLEPVTGTIEPWGTATIVVSCVNNMYGKYRDNLHISLSGMEPAVTVPIKVSVTGSPLFLQPNTKGLRVVSGSTPELHWGHLLQGIPPAPRVIHVSN